MCGPQVLEAMRLGDLFTFLNSFQAATVTARAQVREVHPPVVVEVHPTDEFTLNICGSRDRTRELSGDHSVLLDRTLQFSRSKRDALRSPSTVGKTRV